MPFTQSPRLKYLLALIAGALLPLAYAPYGLLLLPVLSLAVLFYISRRATPRQAFSLGWLYGLGMFGVGVSWLQISIHQFGIPSLWFSVPVTVAFVMFISLYPAIVLGLAQRLDAFATPARTLLLLPALWTLQEWVRGWLFTGFPWLNLGYSQTDSQLVGFAPLVGVYGISYLLVLSACLLLMINQARGRRRLYYFIPLLCVWLAGAVFERYEWTHKQGDDLSVALVQGAVPQERKWLREELEPTKKLYLGLTEPVWGHDVIVWPETAIPAFHSQLSDFLLDLQARAVASGSDILLGLAYKKQGDSKYYNSILNFGAEPGVYKKRHLVPFGEYLPFNDLLRPLLSALSIPMSQFSKGEQEAPVLQVAGQTFGFSICYEDAFGEEVIQALPAATVLVNISNDAWFGDSIAPHQHLQMARMRAQESQRFMLRATNTGISAVIDNRGQIIARSPAFVPHTLTALISPMQGTTPYAQTGNGLIIAFCVLLFVFGLRNRRET